MAQVVLDHVTVLTNTLTAMELARVAQLAVINAQQEIHATNVVLTLVSRMDSALANSTTKSLQDPHLDSSRLTSLT